jgi:nucleotide sugar dehydrogenase
MKSIGVIGMGFVGLAVMEGMKHAFQVFWYDKYKRPRNACDGDYYTNYCDSVQKLAESVDGPIFVCVPTPMNKDGSCDVTIVESVLDELNLVYEDLFYDHPGKTQVVIIKSTIPPGTTDSFSLDYEYLSLVFNPEFLRESSFLDDFKKQDRIIIGGPHAATAIVKQMYQQAYPQVPTTKTSAAIAEMVKYVTNCFLATKVSFANEIADVCRKMNIDYDKVIEYATKDTRLGMSHWSVPGPDGKVGFSGSCFPKDLNALISLAERVGCHPNVMKAAWQTNLRVRPEKDWEQLKGRAVKE